jgi:hypothetical protein
MVAVDFWKVVHDPTSKKEAAAASSYYKHRQKQHSKGPKRPSRRGMRVHERKRIQSCIRLPILTKRLLQVEQNASCRRNEMPTTTMTTMMMNRLIKTRTTMKTVTKRVEEPLLKNVPNSRTCFAAILAKEAAAESKAANKKKRRARRNAVRGRDAAKETER